MKVAAHPLVVAVALGLLAPQALEAQLPEPPPTCHDDEEEGRAGTHAAGARDTGAHAAGAPGAGLHGLVASGIGTDEPSTTAFVWEAVEAPSAEEIRRVELEWLKVTG